MSKRQAMAPSSRRPSQALGKLGKLGYADGSVVSQQQGLEVPGGWKSECCAVFCWRVLWNFRHEDVQTWGFNSKRLYFWCCTYTIYWQVQSKCGDFNRLGQPWCIYIYLSLLVYLQTHLCVKTCTRSPPKLVYDTNSAIKVAPMVVSCLYHVQGYKTSNILR